MRTDLSPLLETLLSKPEEIWTDENRQALAAYRWANWRDEIDAMQLIVSEIPDAHLTWNDLPESRLTLQFAIHLTPVAADAVVILHVQKHESHALRPAPGALGRLLTLKLRSLVWKVKDGWHALCIDGSRWKLHEQRQLWIRDQPRSE
jgi:hypothetical protein